MDPIHRTDHPPINQLLFVALMTIKGERHWENSDSTFSSKPISSKQPVNSWHKVNAVFKNDNDNDNVGLVANKGMMYYHTAQHILKSQVKSQSDVVRLC